MPLETGFEIRHAAPSDYAPVLAVVDDWWGGRPMAHLLQRLFFVHFQETSFIAEHNGALVGFLCGFCSQTFPNESYIHFVGVHPAYRKHGVGRRMYERFFAASRQRGRELVRCITSPANTASIAFHLGMGFTLERSDTLVNGVPVHLNYDGHGGDRVLMVKRLHG